MLVGFLRLIAGVGIAMLVVSAFLTTDFAVWMLSSSPLMLLTITALGFQGVIGALHELNPNRPKPTLLPSADDLAKARKDGPGV